MCADMCGGTARIRFCEDPTGARETGRLDKIGAKSTPSRANSGSTSTWKDQLVKTTSPERNSSPLNAAPQSGRVDRQFHGWLAGDTIQQLNEGAE
jgi:hypothetical protein